MATVPARTSSRKRAGIEDLLVEIEEEYGTPRWIRMEFESDPASSEASNAAYPAGAVCPYSTLLSRVRALAKVWVWAADSRSAKRKWRVVKYDSPPMLKESTRAPSPKMAVMRAPMPT